MIITHYAPSPSGDGRTLLWGSAADSGYSVAVSCPHCGSAVEHLRDGRAYAWCRAAAVACTGCTWSGAVTVELATVRDGRSTSVKREVAVA